MDIAQGNAVDLLKNISISAVTTYRNAGDPRNCSFPPGTRV